MKFKTTTRHSIILTASTLALCGTSWSQTVFNATDGKSFGTIADAIADPDTGAGDVIELGSGTHNGGIMVTKSGLTIKSAAGNPTKPVIQITGPTGVLGTVQIAPGVNNVTIQGLEIIGIDGTPGLEKAAVYLQGAHDGISLIDNVITANGDAAITTEYGQVNSNILIEGNVIDGATFQGPVAGTGPGGQFVEANWPRPLVYMSSGAPSSHSNIVFRGNVISAISGDAINGNVYVNLDGAGITIEDNEFSGSTGTKLGQAMLRVRGTATTVTGNAFRGCLKNAQAASLASIRLVIER